MAQNYYLMHHGVKGMKWGVRRTPEQLGHGKAMADSSKSSQTTLREDARKLFARDLDSRKQERKIVADSSASISKLARPAKPFGPDGKLSKEGRAYMDKVNRINAETDAKLAKCHEAEKQELRNLYKSVFLNDYVKDDVHAAHETGLELDSLASKTIGEGSSYYKKAYAEYAKKNTDLDDAAYGFSHYEWRKGNKYYDQANAEYKSKSSELQKQYESHIRTIANKVTGQDSQDVSFEVDQFVRHRYPEFLSHSNELYHHGIKGMKWGVRRTPAQLGYKPTAGSRIKTKLNDPEFQRKAATAAKIALTVGAMYAGHKIVNDPRVLKAGKDLASNVLANTGKIKASTIKSITNSSEFKIAKTVGKAGLKGGKKVLKVVSSDNFRKTASGIGAVASTAGVLRKQIKDLKNKPEGDTFDKTVDYAKKGSAIGESLNTLARGGSSSSGNSSGNKSIGKEVTDRIGKPSNRGIDKSGQAYQNLFKDRDADTRSTIKSLANAGYDIDQIRKYLEHSAIDGRMVYRGWSFNPMAGCRYIF